MSAKPIVLKALLQQRHMQTHSAFCREYDKVAADVDPTLKGGWPSRAQFYRWLSGDLIGLPYTDHCRILEKMFPGWKIDQLFQVHNGGIEFVPEPPAPQTKTATTPPTAPIFQEASPGLLASVPHSFSADILGGFWVTCYQFDSSRGIQCHADITQLTPQSDRRVTAKNYPPDPRTQGQASPFRNEIEAQLANRHLIGHWKNISDTRYFGSVHLAVLPGETVMDGYYTGFSSDIQVDAMHWKWVRLDPASLSDVDLQKVTLNDPDMIHALLEHTANDVPLDLAAIVEEAR
ncbi:MAG: hypothetical protein M3460_21840 [Actinomycetota bacterium]|nr:hypothetical protein [Actinomycetota bacterium]